MTQHKPFSYRCSSSFPALLHQLKCSLVISTYQAGKLIMVSVTDTKQVIQLPRTFKRAMGVGIEANKMVVATQDEVLLLANAPTLAANYPPQPNTYDALYMPRATYYTGNLDIHDIELLNGKIYAVNTLFSCLVRIDEQYSFTPIWKPPFISHLSAEDRCHLNGMAVVEGAPRYVTAFAATNQPQGWRNKVATGGILMDIQSNKVLLNNLPMPHSPRWYNGNLYILLSGTGELLRFSPYTNEKKIICRLSGFVRGLAKLGDYVFIGISKFRKDSSTYQQIASTTQEAAPGIVAVHLPTGKVVAEMRYEQSVEEIYDVQILPHTQRPGIVNTQRPECKMGLSTPQATYWGKSNTL